MNNTEKLLQQILDSQNKTNERLDKLEAQTTENTQILKALEHNSQVHKAEIDNLTHAVAELTGDVKSIKAAVIKAKKLMISLKTLINFPHPRISRIYFSF